MTPRGFRNNNPLNIRLSTAKWRGKRTPSTDPAFEQFDTIQDGVRAAFRILHTYKTRWHCETIYEIIRRWAPPSENQTNRYVAQVAAGLGLNPMSPVDLANKPLACSLIYHMIRVECGSYLSYNLIEQGYDLAFPQSPKNENSQIVTT